MGAELPRRFQDATCVGCGESGAALSRTVRVIALPLRVLCERCLAAPYARGPASGEGRCACCAGDGEVRPFPRGNVCSICLELARDVLASGGG